MTDFMPELEALKQQSNSTLGPIVEIGFDQRLRQRVANPQIVELISGSINGTLGGQGLSQGAVASADDSGNLVLQLQLGKTLVEGADAVSF